MADNKETLVLEVKVIGDDASAKAIQSLADAQNKAAEAARIFAIEQKRLGSVVKGNSSAFSSSAAAINSAASSFRSGSDGIMAWTDSLSRSKANVSGWVSAMSEVDAVNRKFAAGLHGNVGGVSNWVTAMGQGSNASKFYASAINKAEDSTKKQDKASRGLSSSMGPVGLIVRNSAAQFQDFAVQVQGGQSALLAFAQQAPQLASAFGTIGTVLGTVLAIAVAFPALKAVFGAVGDSSKSLKDALEDLNDAMSDVGKTGHDFDLDGFIEEFNSADAAVRKSILSTLEFQKEIAALADQRAGKSATQGIQGELVPSFGQNTLDLFIAALGNSDDAFYKATQNFDDFTGAQNKLVDGLKISEQAAQELILRMRDFKSLPLDEMQKIILLFDKAGNTQFDGLSKSLKDIMKAAVAFEDQQKKTNKTLKEANEALKTGGTIDTGKPGKKGAGEIVFNNEQLEKSEAIIKRVREEFGLTRVQAAAISGNLFTESKGFQTNIKEDLSGNDPRQAAARRLGGGFGLAQWSGERKKQLKIFADQMGKDISSLDVQIDFLVQELTTTKFGKATIDRLKNINDINDATIVVRQKFEKPNPELAHDDKRIKAAESAFLGGLTNSERQKEVAEEEKFFKERIASNESFQDTLAKITEKGKVREGSKVQQQIIQEQQAAYKSAKIGLGELTSEEVKHKAVLDEAIKSQILNAEAAKLQADQNKVLATVFDNSTYAEQLEKIRQALDDGVISGDKFKEMTIELTRSFNESAQALGAINSFKIDLTDQQKQFDMLNDKIRATQELVAQGRINPELGKETIDSLLSQRSPNDAYIVSLKNQQEEIDKVGDKIKIVQDLAAGGFVSPEIAQQEILQLREMSGQFDTFGGHMVDFFEGKVKSSVDTMVDAMFGAEVSFNDFIEGMLKDIAKFLLQEQITSWFKEFNSGSSGGQGGTGLLDSLVGLFGSAVGGFGGAAANGNAYNMGNVVPFATGGIVTRPTLFGMSGGRTGLMGEAGPEAVVPLSKINGKLGIKAEGMGGSTSYTVNQVFNVQNGDERTMKKAAGQGARDVLGMAGGAQRYR